MVQERIAEGETVGFERSTDAVEEHEECVADLDHGAEERREHRGGSAGSRRRGYLIKLGLLPGLISDR